MKMETPVTFGEVDHGLPLLGGVQSVSVVTYQIFAD
jgi:hypothetical protein